MLLPSFQPYRYINILQNAYTVQLRLLPPRLPQHLQTQTPTLTGRHPPLMMPHPQHLYVLSK